jgi:hypothetical protein
MSLPPDILRQKQKTLDEWIEDYASESLSKEDRDLLTRSARTLHRNPVASGIIARIEAKFVHALVSCPPSEPQKAEALRLQLVGLRRFWQEVAAMAADADLLDKQNPS